LSKTSGAFYLDAGRTCSQKRVNENSGSREAGASSVMNFAGHSFTLTHTSLLNISAWVTFPSLSLLN